MERDSILLVDVSAPYVRALSAWHQRYGRGQLRIVQELPDLSILLDSGLCIVEVRGGSVIADEHITGLCKAPSSCPIVVLALETGVDLAVRWIRLGVADVIQLPAPPDDVAARAFSHVDDPTATVGDDELVGQSSAMWELRQRIASAARVSSTVLLQGETGTGKGLVARSIHAASSRSDQPFVHVDCAALSPTLIESDLFGHEKGAFTGAAGLRRGRFETANRGTIFLDEIGDLDTTLQSKLLRVLQDRTYERVGGTQTLRMQARVISATSHDLLRAVHERRFRQDLYFRLNVLKIRVPPLREHQSDVPLLVQAGLKRLSAGLRVAVPQVSDGFYRRVGEHGWPGNVRELINLLERCLVERRVTTLEEEDLEGLLDPGAPEPVPESSLPAEGPSNQAHTIRAALIEAGGNISRASRRLRMSRGGLRYWIEKHGLQSLIPHD